MKRIFIAALFVIFLLGNWLSGTFVFKKNAPMLGKTYNCEALEQKFIDKKTELVSSKEGDFDSFLPKIEFICRLGQFETEKTATKASPVRQKIMDGGFKTRIEAMRFAKSCGFSAEDSVTYAFPEIADLVFKLENKLYTPPTDAKLAAVKNKAKAFIEKEQNGTKMDKIALFNDIFYNFNNFSKSSYRFNVKEKPIEAKVKERDFKDNLNLRGSFKTSFAASSSSRKNNIKKALSFFDGVVIYPQQSLSFNETTGVRGEAGGYEKAKIIKNGSFVTEFGGGVCQVSTTLYNAALLADLEIVEVHPHSLPVSYVSPCFDAMVNSGSSDLVIRNPHNFPVIITTAYDENSCQINIYGCKNIYQIVRKSEKIEDLLQIKTERTTDYGAYGLSGPLRGEEERIVCYGKPGYRAKGTLEYYKDGKLVKQSVIRENVYSPTKNIILVAEK